ncbi:GTPase HflX [candidate division TM6 bacterium RIFCSPHIGHO2_12_FULL_32_22]|nr:MAG: GTPase HflX [candidate division TM6 bacterium RIFCSPHIGHO2_12_FULL_32_22]
MSRKPELTNKEKNTLIVGIYAPYNKSHDINSYFEEFKNLVKTNQKSYNGELFIKLRDIDSATFMGSGQLDKIKEICKEKSIERVIISEPLTVQQERNITDILNCEVADRTELILEIFDKAAVSAEGKLQVEIAILRHRKSRLAGRGIHLSQQEGRIGGRGPGETAKEVAARHINERITNCRKQLEKLETTRETQRKKRLSTALPLACLIGYTNAGKSTILNTLTKSNVLAEDKLFATLDTTTRELFINHEKFGLISDTVGFIQELPHQLIEAFKSTLSELKYADLLLHVVDISDKNWQTQIEVVHELLEELDLQRDMIYVFNKADKVVEIPKEVENYQPHVIISALDKETIQPLKNYLEEWKRIQNEAKIQ